VSILLSGVHGQPLSRCDQAQSRALAQDARRDVAAKNFDAAALKLHEASLACPDDKSILVERANALFMARRLADARSAASEVLRDDPGNAAALKIKGNAEYLLGYVQQSMSTFVSLLDRHPRDEDGAYMLGRIYYQEGRIDQAIGLFERVLRTDPESYRAWDNLGLCWQANGDNEKAIAHFLQAIKLVEKDHPEYDWAYANLADLLVKTGDAEHAFAAAAKAANRNPTSARNFYIGAKALEKLGKTELCLNWSQRAAALDPNYSEPQYLLSRIYHRLGQEDKAEEARRRFEALKAKEPSQKR
jgi:superkiller protein 3